MKKFAILLLAAALFACKKDDPVSSFTITSDTSMDFLPGQTKEITYTSAHIVRHNAPTVPTGWTVRQDGKRYLVTAPSGSDGEAVGTIKINVTGLKDITLSRSVSVAVRTASEISGAARSIVVTEDDRRFRFAVSLAGAVRAERVWSTSKTSVQNVSYEDGYVYFATGATFEPANALVAVLDKDGNALDSWHIWATAEQPAAVQVGDYLVMDRNLGALSARDFGLYYQWGRPAPFAGPVTLYNHKGSVTTHTFATDEGHSVAYGLAHPGTFIAGIEASNFDWATDLPAANSWWSDGDPCPEGWQIAPPAFYETLSPVGEFDGGWNLAVLVSSGGYLAADAGLGLRAAGGSDPASVFFPAAGRRSFSPSLATWKKNYTNVVNDPDGNGAPVGFYWTGVGGQSFAFDGKQIVAGPLSDAAVVDLTTDKTRVYRAGGFSVRCIQPVSLHN